MNDDLAGALVAAGRSIDWPEPAPGLPDAVTARLDEAVPAPRSSLGLVAAIAIVVVVSVLAVPSARQAAADILARAGIRITFGEVSVEAPGARLMLGDPVRIDELPTAVDFTVRVPVGDPPDSIHVDDSGAVHLVWVDGDRLPETVGGGISSILSQSRDDEMLVAGKVVSDADAVVGVSVDGVEGLWIEGAPHQITQLDADGEPITATTRLAANVLLWDRGGVRHRLETIGGLDSALDLVADLESAG